MAGVLLIDDDESFRTMIRMALEYNGHALREASDGKQGLRLFRQTPADLVITDIFMPEQEGLETIMTLRRENLDVPIIAVSGGGRFGKKNYLDMAESLGTDKALEKPLCIRSFLFWIQELLDGPVRHGDLCGRGPSHSGQSFVNEIRVD